MVSSSFVALAITLASSSSVHAFWRVSCGQPLVSERVDPVISPNTVPSNHVHTVHGAKNFAANSTFDTLSASSCTSCSVTQDKSNYWFPKLYFHDSVAKTFEEVSNGGLLIYYQQRGDLDVANGGSGIKAFPKGFKMISGNPSLRSMDAPLTDNTQWGLSRRATFFSCLRGSAPGYDGYGFPTTNCESGLNHRIHFPACWDGVNVDSPNHSSHVAYLSGLDNGSCPKTHPVGLLKLFYEVTWDVNAFASRWNPSTQAWPFVLATGDPTGYSWHGDFQNGWDPTLFQNSIDNCRDPNGVTENCSYMTVQSATVSNTCKATPVVNEVITGTLSKLPGCNPLQAGPGNSTIYSDSNCPK